jgi:glycosyltransferase involved in cell wall biosynthesis
MHARLKLIIVHYHLRPGGVRRVIESAAPHLARQFGGRIREVVLAAGEADDAKWNRDFKSLLGGTRVELFVDPSLGYWSEQKRKAPAVVKKLRAALERLLANADGENCLVWAHNLGIGRNLLLKRELLKACDRRAIPVLAHHHDWWFDNRWQRWPEMRQCGFRTLAAVADAVFPAHEKLRHIAVNRADARVLQRHFPGRARWLPNLTERRHFPTPQRRNAAAAWLRRELNEKDAPVWLMPCRLLRRKNVAEALLLTRWLRPGGWLVTTGGASSADEMIYFQRLDAAARRHGWPLRLGILQEDEARKPSVEELLAVSEVVMLTSLQEGFGLPFIEAAVANRPLIARKLPGVAPDLARLGFRFPQSYDEILVAPSLFDWKAEVKRQRKRFRAWKMQLPRDCRRLAVVPVVLAVASHPQPVPFSRLTLAAQLEVLAAPLDDSWQLCAPLNPLLAEWQQRALKSRLQLTPWPRRADEWLSGPAFGACLARIAERRPGAKLRHGSGLAAQQQFIREKLGAENLFPLLCCREG